MTREKFRLAIVIILVAFLWCYYEDMSRPQYPKYLPHTQMAGVVECDTGLVITYKGTYTPTLHGLEFESIEESKKFDEFLKDNKKITPEEYLRKKQEETNNPSQ